MSSVKRILLALLLAYYSVKRNVIRKMTQQWNISLMWTLKGVFKMIFTKIWLKIANVSTPDILIHLTAIRGPRSIPDGYRGPLRHVCKTNCKIFYMAKMLWMISYQLVTIKILFTSSLSLSTFICLNIPCTTVLIAWSSKTITSKLLYCNELVYRLN